MKTLGIILAAGRSSRLFPATIAVSKQILPIYDKPLIYYPLSTLMLAGIKDVCIITNPKEQFLFQKLLGNAKEELGMNIEFAVQGLPRGLPEAFTIAQNHYKSIGNYLDDVEKVALILGDNIYYGAGLSEMLEKTVNRKGQVAHVFLQHVRDPQRFGVANFDKEGNIEGLEEKPIMPRSNYAVTGLYFFPKTVFDRSKDLIPSKRGELEITDLLRKYLEERCLISNKMYRGMSWFDTGTPESLLEASGFVKTIQDHQGLLVGSPHEIAYRNHWIEADALINFTRGWEEKTPYGRYLIDMVLNG